MLSVVERQPVADDAPRATPEVLGRFVQCNSVSSLGECQRRGATGPAAADDRNRYALFRAVFHAIHNFRSGVSDVRRSSTLKPSWAISSRSVR